MYMKIITKCLILAAIFVTTLARAEITQMDDRTANRICDAVFRIEGGNNTKYPYGIMSVKTGGNKEVARRIERVVGDIIEACALILRNREQRQPSNECVADMDSCQNVAGPDWNSICGAIADLIRVSRFPRRLFVLSAPPGASLDKH